MNRRIENILARIDDLTEQLEDEIAEGRKAFSYKMIGRRIRFENEVKARHRDLRIGLGKFLSNARLSHVVTAPVIYSLILPFMLLDLFVTIYQAVCFPAYGIPKVPRSQYIRMDRHHLAYLNGLQKLNCLYCGYCNGLLSWVREIASRTEAYWCPIKHAGPVRHPHGRYANFVDFGDADGFGEGLERSGENVTRKN